MGRVNDSLLEFTNNLKTTAERVNELTAAIQGLPAIATGADIAAAQDPAVLTTEELGNLDQGVLRLDDLGGLNQGVQGSIRPSGGTTGGGGGGGVQETSDQANTEAVDRCTQAMIDNLEELRQINQTQIELNRAVRSGEDQALQDRRQGN